MKTKTCVNLSNNSAGNTYLPKRAVIKKVILENSQIKTFVLEFTEKPFNDAFYYQPGQFMMVSVPHHGEAPISVSSTPTRPGNIHLSVRVAGRLTRALHDMEPGREIGLRGPYGRAFPMDSLKGKDLVFVAGGIGLAPLRSAINYCLDRSKEYGRITILYGSRLPSDIAFRADLEEWTDRDDVRCLVTVDEAEPGWEGYVGVVTTLWDKAKLDPERQAVLVCGPPVMIRFVLADLREMGFPDDNVITTMERHMKCGVGLCGHCHMEGKLVCVDGPVFSSRELREISVEYKRGATLSDGRYFSFT